MESPTNQSGFSAVELLVTLFIGAIFLIAGQQLYMVVVKSGAESYSYSLASQDAQSWARRTINNAQTSDDGGCTTGTWPIVTTPTPSPGIDLTTVTVSCPNSTNFPNLRKVSVTSSRQGKVATHAVYYTAL